MNRARNVVVSAFVCLVAAAAQAQEWRGPASLAVEVKGKPRGSVAEALVILRYQQVEPSAGPRPVLTDAAGRAVLVDLAEGVWEVEVSHDDFLSFVALVLVDSRRKPQVQASFLQASGSSLTPIRVKFADGKGRQPSASVPLPPEAAARLAQRRPLPAPTPPATTAPPEPVGRPTRPTRPVMPEPELRPLPEAARPATAPAPPPQEELAESRPEPRPPIPESPTPTPEPPTPKPASAPQPGATPAVIEPAAPAEPRPEPAPTALEPAAAPAPEPLPTPEPKPPLPKPAAPTPPPAALAVPEAVVPPEPAAPVPAPAEPTEPDSPPSVPEPEIEPAVSEPAPTTPPEPPSPEASLPEPPPAAEDALPVPPEPRPAPAQPPAQPPTAALPPPGPLGPTLRSYRDRTCVECRPGEWAISVEVVTGPASGPCGSSLEAEGQEIATLLGSSVALELKELAAPADVALGEMSSAEPSSRIAELLGDDSRACRIVAAVIPKAGRFRGLRMEAADASGVGDCQADRPCPVGHAHWIGQPRVAREPSANVIWGQFVNEADDRARRARLTVYFAAPYRAWDPSR